MEGGTSKFKTHTTTLCKKKKWSSVSEKRPQKWPSQRLESEQPQVSVLGKRRRESQTPAQESLESKWLQKAKRKKRRKKRRRESQTPAQESLESEQPPVSMRGKRRRQSQTPAQESLENEQPWKAKRKKKKESQQLTSSLLKNSETFHKAKKTTSAHKKKKNSVWEVDVETGVILVDKENMENLLETSRKDVDIVYVDMSKRQRSARVDETEELPTAQEYDCRELHSDVRSKKNQKHPQKGAPWDAVQGSQPESISLFQSEFLSSVDLEGKCTEVAVFCKKKSKKKSVQEPGIGDCPYES